MQKSTFHEIPNTFASCCYFPYVKGNLYHQFGGGVAIISTMENLVVLALRPADSFSFMVSLLFGGVSLFHWVRQRNLWGPVANKQWKSLHDQLGWGHSCGSNSHDVEYRCVFTSPYSLKVVPTSYEMRNFLEWQREVLAWRQHAVSNPLEVQGDNIIRRSGNFKLVLDSP